ncbi:hypothetical protein HK097_001199, partial [Rhizophlyctis rosea]
HLQGIVSPTDVSSKLTVRSPPRTASLIAEFSRRVRLALEKKMDGTLEEPEYHEAVRLFVRLVEDEAKGHAAKKA